MPKLHALQLRRSCDELTSLSFVFVGRWAAMHCTSRGHGGCIE